MSEPPRDREPLERNSWRFGIFSGFVGLASIVSAASSESWLRIAIVIVATLVAGVATVFLIERRARKRDQLAADDPVTELTRRSERFQKAYDEFADYLEKVQQAINEQKVARDALIAQAQQAMDEQKAARDALIAQAQQQQHLLSLSKEQAERVQKIIMSETVKLERAERRRQLAYLVLGVLTSIPIGIVINYFT
ncbi:hypothetical protein [Nonomuraea sp. NPDC050643]|uniref:hypothetical protein n=1 Tax=Nonomuraea sp. NPDC050643 TaxID=3155660 RepID=UPI00341090BA